VQRESKFFNLSLIRAILFIDWRIFMSTTAEETEKTTKTKLLLDSLEIKGYRCFEHLTIEKLGRVNLIVGKNNVGKTALLEALWIYSNVDLSSRETLDGILASRNENSSYNLYEKKYIPNHRHLFFNRDHTAVIEIGSLGGSLTVKVKRDMNQFTISTYDLNERLIMFNITNEDEEIKRPSASFFIRIGRLTEQDINLLWERVELTPLEDRVLTSLKLILPKIVKVRPKLVGELEKNLDKVIYAQIEDDSEPFPLKTFGEGLSTPTILD